MASVDLDRVAALLAATAAHLRHELKALGEDGASFHPAEGEWCAKSVVGHMLEADRRGFSGRIRAILAEDRPELVPWNQEAVAADRHDCDQPLSVVLGEFEGVRKEGLALVATLTEQDLDRVGLHPHVGELSIRDVLHEWPFHDREHLRQILENTRALLWPEMGNARRFSEIDAAPRDDGQS